jgi:hypothetical protein
MSEWFRPQSRDVFCFAATGRNGNKKRKLNHRLTLPDFPRTLAAWQGNLRPEPPEGQVPRIPNFESIMQDKTKARLQSKKIELLLKTAEYARGLKDVCHDIVTACGSANNEASVVTIFELELFSLIKTVFGLTYYPVKEMAVKTIRHVSKGKIDSKIGALVIEFKHESALRTASDKQKATVQITEYLNGLYSQHESDYYGFITDGHVCKFVRKVEGAILESSFETLNWQHLDQIIRTIVLLEKRGLTPANLVKDFCEPVETSLAKRLVLVLYDALRTHATGRTKMLFNEWKELFRLAHDDKSKQRAIEERRKALSAIIDTSFKDNETEYLILYSLQTAFAILVKIIAYKVVSKIRFNQSLIEFHKLAEADSDALRDQMYLLEEGAIFRSMGIGNLLEGDFFAWYSTKNQWNNEIGCVIKEVFAVLSRYEDKALFDKGNDARDLFKDLFLEIVPDKVRHSMGEFYTPPWLADNLIRNCLKYCSKKDWRALDPCGGSGTFVTALIKKVLLESQHLTPKQKLEMVLLRVKAVDLNPLAVLTMRINYFVNIAHLIGKNDEFEIPVYLGDSSYVPERVAVAGVECYRYQIKTLKGSIQIELPRSVVKSPEGFSRVMTEMEQDIKNKDEQAICKKFLSVTAKEDRKPLIKKRIQALAKKFVELEKNDWNGIWARIITNFLTTANLGRFDLIVGNPPWIDWKNLPAGYRDRIKSLCIDRRLFSGDSITGGINLNICGLISNVAAQNWLAPQGILGFLMPQSLIFQQSYEGFRNFALDNDKRLFFQELYDWTKAGHPFHPVQHKFLTFFITATPKNYAAGIPVTFFCKTKGPALSRYAHQSDFTQMAGVFREEKHLAGQANRENTAFTYAKDATELENFRAIAGECEYTGREGIEFYPQEVFLLEIDEQMQKRSKHVFVKNFQNRKSKYKIAQGTLLLEKIFLHPLVKGTDIERFHLSTPQFLVPFPYDKRKPRSPIGIKTLTRRSRNLATFLTRFKDVIETQTSYNEKIIGKKHYNEFYALARVGKYSFANHYVAFRDNTKWLATVVSSMSTPWGERKRPCFQNHAVSICERKDGSFISRDEAHYLCGALNAPVTGRFLVNSSDSRSFKIRPPVRVPLYDPKNPDHVALSELSKLAHLKHADKEEMGKIDKKLDALYVKICKAALPSKTRSGTIKK